MSSYPPFPTTPNWFLTLHPLISTYLQCFHLLQITIPPTSLKILSGLSTPYLLPLPIGIRDRRPKSIQKFDTTQEIRVCMKTAVFEIDYLYHGEMP